MSQEKNSLIFEWRAIFDCCEAELDRGNIPDVAPLSMSEDDPCVYEDLIGLYVIDNQISHEFKKEI